MKFDENLKKVKSGRAAPNLFDDLEINAYGEKHKFSEFC
jgi:ribosome recycling factor